MEVRTATFCRSLHLNCLGSDQIGELDRLGQREFDVLARLFDQRRSLPVYREGLWCCYDCNFYSADIEEVGQHLLTVHQALAPDEEEDTDAH
jgi:hypothetical protein